MRIGISSATNLPRVSRKAFLRWPASVTDAENSRRTSRLPKGQTEPVLELRVVICVADIDRDLRHGSRPGDREFSGGLVVAEQHISDSLSFSAREPGRHKGIALGQRFVDNH